MWVATASILSRHASQKDKGWPKDSIEVSKQSHAICLYIRKDRKKKSSLHLVVQLKLLEEFPRNLHCLIHLSRVETDTLRGGTLSTGLTPDNFTDRTSPVLSRGLLRKVLDSG
jgi:hypothetical protein